MLSVRTMVRHFLYKKLMIGLAFVAPATSVASVADGLNRASAVATTILAETRISAVPTKDCSECPEILEVPSIGHQNLSLRRSFYVMRFELTWRDFLMPVKSGVCPPLRQKLNSYEPWPPIAAYPYLEDNYPVTSISPDEMGCYLGWLKAKTGKVYRIPSAEEWEHVARAGSATRYPWGNDLGFDHAVVEGAYDKVRLRLRFPKLPTWERTYRPLVAAQELWPVGSFPPNAWGLYDVIGNAGEVTSQVLTCPPSVPRS